MAPDELKLVRELVDREAATADDPPAISGWLQRMCRAAARDLPASGVGVSLVNDRGELMTAAASGTTSTMVEELQFMLGEGPCLDAYASRLPVLVPDLDGRRHTTWPGYAPAAFDHGVRSVFAFPLGTGVVRLGALDVYRREVGDLSPVALGRALTFVEVAVQGLLDARSRGDGIPEAPDSSELMRYEVYQAQGMLMVQLGVTPEDAMARLRAHAYVADRRLADVAADVINRRVFLERDGS